MRLSRAQTQERNRGKVLAAARAEFAERGFRAAKIDDVAERAELTRGAVYSNFPGKRALYFAVLAEDAERVSLPPNPGETVREALGAFARASVSRLPLASDDEYGQARLGVELFPEVLADERTRVPFAQLMRLNALLLGLALERLEPSGRMVRVAEIALTTLAGAGQMAAAAPGFVEPFGIVKACERLAELALNDVWLAPRLTPHVEPVNSPWSPPEAIDAVGNEHARLTGDGVVAFLGLHRLSVVEEAVRAGAEVTVVLVTSDPGELIPLARLAIADFASLLRHAFPRSAWPRVQVVCDETGALAAAAGVPAVSDVTQAAVRIESGRIVLRAEGYGACEAAAARSSENLSIQDRN
ncbi:MAG: TetR/AcrR family transcriptional regulator [Kibdelosporangium sp.]